MCLSVSLRLSYIDSVNKCACKFSEILGVGERNVSQWENTRYGEVYNSEWFSSCGTMRINQQEHEQTKKEVYDLSAHEYEIFRW